jgi:predicted MFS family arabinose efflux permease
MSKRALEDQTNWGRVLLGFLLAVYAAFLQFKLSPALPEMLTLFTYDPAMAGGFMSIYAVMGLLFSAAIGRWLNEERINRIIRQALLASIFAQLATLLVAEYSVIVLILRGIEGVAFAIFAIAGPVIVGQSACKKHKPFGIGLSATWMPGGLLLSSLSYYYFGDLFGWSILWCLGAVFGALLWAWARNQSVESSVAQKGTSRSEPSISNHQKVSLLLAATVFLLWSIQFNAYMTWFTTYVSTTLGYSRSDAVWVFILPIIVIAMINVPVGLAQRTGKATLILMGCGLTIQTFSWVLAAIVEQPGLQVLALIAYGIAAGIVPACLFGCPRAILGDNNAPYAFSRLMLGRYIGVFLGPLLVGMAASNNLDWTNIMGTAALITAIPIVVTIVLYFRVQVTNR